MFFIPCRKVFILKLGLFVASCLCYYVLQQHAQSASVDNPMRSQTELMNNQLRHISPIEKASEPINKDAPKGANGRSTAADGPPGGGSRQISNDTLTVTTAGDSVFRPLDSTTAHGHDRKAGVTQAAVPSRSPADGKLLPRCIFPPRDLDTNMTVNLTEPRSFDEVAAAHPEVQLGGKWKPSACISRSKMALIIPYRNREKNLKIFLRHMHTFLQKQEIDYQIFVVEQAGETQFNRGMMRNIGFEVANKMGTFECTVFHDVDLMPENQKNFYHCPALPRHLCVAINTRNYRFLGTKWGGGAHVENRNGFNFAVGGAVFGGAVELTNEHFREVNGYSNFYFGWGGEDDDLHKRIMRQHLWVERPNVEVGRYTESLHEKDKRASKIMRLFEEWKARADTDGLNSLNYTVQARTLLPTHTHLLVDIDEKMYKKRIQRFFTSLGFGLFDSLVDGMSSLDNTPEGIREALREVLLAGQDDGDHGEQTALMKRYAKLAGASLHK